MSQRVLPTEPGEKDGTFHMTETASTAFPMDSVSPPTSADALGIVGIASAQRAGSADDQGSSTARATALLEQAEVRAEHQAQARTTMLDLAAALDESNSRRHHLATLLNQEQRGSSDLKRQLAAMQRRMDDMERAEEERQAKILLDKALKSGNTMVFGMLLQKSREAYGTNYFGPGKGDNVEPPASGAGAGFSAGSSSGAGGGAGGAAAGGGGTAGGRTTEGTARGYGARGDGPRGSQAGSGRVEGGAAGRAPGTEAEGGGDRESAGGARESAGGARESAGGARDSIDEDRESTGGARDSTGGARESTGGGRESIGGESEAEASGTGNVTRGSAAGASEVAGSGAGGLEDEASGTRGSRTGETGAVGGEVAGAEVGVDAAASRAEDSAPGGGTAEGAQLVREHGDEPSAADRPISRGSKSVSSTEELHEPPPERSASKGAARRATGWDFVVNKGDVGDRVTIQLTIKLWKNVVDKIREARAAELAELERLRLEEERKRQIEEEKRKAVEAIKRIAQALEERLAAAQETIRQHEKRQADLEKELQAARDLMAEKEAEHEERMRQLQSELDSTRQELASMKGQLLDLQNQYEGALENLRNADKQFADERRQLKDQIRNITSELAEAMVLAKHMRETALKAKREAAGSVSPAKFAELIGQLEEMKNQLSALWKDFMKETDTNDALRRNLDKNKRQLELERQFLPLLHKVRGPLGPKKGADIAADGPKKKDATQVPNGMPPIDNQTKMRMSKSTGALGGPLGGPLGGGRLPGGYESQDITRLQLASSNGLSAVPTLS